MRNIVLLLIFLFTFHINSQSQTCRLNIGTNLSGISDWMTEMPFVDMMHNARTWGTRNRTWIGGNAQNHWNTELIHLIEKDENGYPLELPFFSEDLALEDSQMVFTVWAWLEAWEPGIYTFLYDGEGDFDFRTDGKIIKSEPGRAEVEIIPSADSFLELVISRSVKGNHLRNFRLIMPGHQESYITQPFNPLYLERLADFAALRFMDWGSTNNWGADNFWENFDEPTDTALVPWAERSKMQYYTWAHNKGVPYEIMCQLCNALHKDMWVCVPHNASNEYITEMASLIKETLNPELKVYAEYSNEIWNWMFGQTHWLNTFFCEDRGKIWPEGIVDNVQRNLDVWGDVFTDQRERLILVAGGQTGYQDVTNRIVHNLRPGSFDALNITAYFGFGEQGDSQLDVLGSAATVSDVVYWVRKNMYEQEINYIKNQHQLAQELNMPIVFYEAGQHITPHPFGEEPTYAQALLDLHRDTAMYNLYNEWFNLVESVLTGDEKSMYMNFSFVGGRSSRYGSWGILETLDQDTTVVYAPKFQAIIDKIYQCNKPLVNSELLLPIAEPDIQLSRLDANLFFIRSNMPITSIKVYGIDGQLIILKDMQHEMNCVFNVDKINKGLFLFEIRGEGFRKIFMQYIP